MNGSPRRRPGASLKHNYWPFRRARQSSQADQTRAGYGRARFESRQASSAPPSQKEPGQKEEERSSTIDGTCEETGNQGEQLKLSAYHLSYQQGCVRTVWFRQMARTQGASLWFSKRLGITSRTRQASYFALCFSTEGE